MRKVINKKVYDTDKAEEIASYSFSNRNAFRYVRETLYKTANGAYFLAGEGGPMSKYQRDLGDGHIGGGEAITPLTRMEAYEWCEEHDVDAATIEREFGDLITEA
jgi:hypothetical protein